jgi:hypothetical protein
MPSEPNWSASTVITVQIRVIVDDKGVATLRLPPDITPGPHEAVLVIEEALAQNKTPIMEGFPRHDVGPWPEGFTVRREDIYDDDGR